MDKIVYAFDIDDTLDVSAGPIAVDVLRELRNRGHIIGLCGNWAVFVQAVPDWHEFISFIGPMSMTKEEFLTQIKSYIPCSRYVLVGNIKGVSGASDDEGAARKAHWEFVKESEFIATTSRHHADNVRFRWSRNGRWRSFEPSSR